MGMLSWPLKLERVRQANSSDTDTRNSNIKRDSPNPAQAEYQLVIPSTRRMWSTIENEYHSDIIWLGKL